MFNKSVELFVVYVVLVVRLGQKCTMRREQLENLLSTQESKADNINYFKKRKAGTLKVTLQETELDNILV